MGSAAAAPPKYAAVEKYVSANIRAAIKQAAFGIRYHHVCLHQRKNQNTKQRSNGDNAFGVVANTTAALSGVAAAASRPDTLNHSMNVRFWATMTRQTQA